MARPRTDIKPRIVHAARARFLAEGVDGASLRTIAADAGTNIGMVFYYFPNKDDLFLAVVEEFYAKLLDDLALYLGGDAPLRERLRRVFARLGTTNDEEIAVVRLVAREALLSNERFKRILARLQRGHVALLLQALAEGVQHGEIDPGIHPAMLLVATLGLGGLPQLVRRAAGSTAPFSMLPPPDELAETSVQMLFRAIGNKEPAAAKTRKPARRKGARRSVRGAR